MSSDNSLSPRGDADVGMLCGVAPTRSHTGNCQADSYVKLSMDQKSGNQNGMDRNGMDRNGMDQKIMDRNIRHELRTQLNQIIGYSDLLIDEVTQRELHDLTPDLKKIHCAGLRLLALVNEHIDPINRRADNTKQAACASVKEESKKEESREDPLPDH